MSNFSRDNISGIRTSSILSALFLLPGRVIQWATYMTASGKGYRGVRASTRQSRSPIMTVVYSLGAWAVGLFYGFMSLMDYLGVLAP